MFGMTPVPIHGARVLEIGCCDGGNLIPMAHSLLASEFVGIDLTEADIAQARETAAALQLSNVQFHAMDLTCLPGSLGQFDYIVAHGVYTWIPLEVREKMMSAIQQSLSPNGVAYISYNTLPGCHFRLQLREMMLLYTNGIVDPIEKLAAARQVLEFMVNREESGADEKLISDEAKRFLDRADHSLFHDELEPHYKPVYFHEFASHAARNGLQYISETDYFTTRPEYLGSDAAPKFVKAMSAFRADPLKQQQYLDFSAGRPFRASLICHREIQLDRAVQPSSLQSLQFLSPCDSSTAENGETVFTRGAGLRIQTSGPAICKIMNHLNGAWPRPVPFDAIPGADSDPAQTAEILLALLNFGMIDPASHSPELTLVPGEKPTANPVARLQCAQGRENLTDCRGYLNKSCDALQRSLLPLLDGTRTRADLLAELPSLTPADLESSLNAIAGFYLLTH
jgi:cyclopropane fatty-acyl-phospholipid synthase-like methyltransferase